MGLLDVAFGPLRRALGTAEREVVVHSPMHETREVERKLLEGIEAVHRATDSIERHVEVIETLATSLPPLTASVTRLTDQLNALMELTAPLAAAEHEVSRIEHLFGRHRHERDAPPPPEPPSRPA
jgi:hypothetical protein